MAANDVINMADRGRSEIGKSVKNPLLSGASAGFPFENFPGSSLLVPVQRDSPPVLLEDVGEVDTFVGQDKPASDDLNLISVPTSANPASTASANQGYTGLFSSFFGGSQPPKVEPAVEVKPPESLSVESTPRSFSPYVHVPSVESYSPALFVPTGPPHQVPHDLKEGQREVERSTLIEEPLAAHPTVPAASRLSGDSPRTQAAYQSQPASFHHPSAAASSIAKPPSNVGPQRDAQNPYRQFATPFDVTPLPSLLPTASEVPKTSVPSSSSSSSSDSIVTDLQSRFGATSISDSVPDVKPLTPSEVTETALANETEEHQSPDGSANPHGLLGIFSSDQYPGSHSTSDFFGLPQDPSDNSYQTQSPALFSYGAIGQPRGPSYSVAPIPTSQAHLGPPGTVGQPKPAAYPVIPGGHLQSFIETSTSPFQTPPQSSFPSRVPGSGFPSASTTSTVGYSPLQPGTTATILPPTDSGSGQWLPFAQDAGAASGLTSQHPTSLAQPPLSAGPPPVGAATTIPRSTGGSTKSYRLGAQRRLAYAPVPGLASSPPSQNLPPAASSFAPPQTFCNPQDSGIAPNLYNPSATYHTSGETASPQLFARDPPAPSPVQPHISPSFSPDTVGPPTAQPAAFVPPPASDVLPPAFIPPASSPPAVPQYRTSCTDASAVAPPAFISSQNSPSAFIPPSSNGTLPSGTAPVGAPHGSTFFTSSVDVSPTARPIAGQAPPVHTSNLFTPGNSFPDAPNPPSTSNSTAAPSAFYTFTPLEPAPYPGASNFFTPASSDTLPQGNTTNYFAPISPSFPPPPPAAVLPTMTTRDDAGTLNTVDLSTPAPPRRSPSPSVVPPRLLNLGQSGIIYRPPYYHWFWNKGVDGKEDWQPFSMTDSFELEQAYNSAALTMDTVVATDGGRHDVQIVARRRDAVYWQEPSRDVRRCSWFYKPADIFVPYDENTAAILEEEYKAAVMTSSWKRQVPLSNGAYVLLFGPSTMLHYSSESPSPDAWDASTDLSQSAKPHPKEVKRGVEDFNIEDGEPAEIDHLLFFVHGIGSVCDLKMRSIEEAVRDFRNTAQELLKTHYRTSFDRGEVTRIEVLPVSWHQNLHSDTGVDEKLKKITLKSIPRLRHFTNDTLLDILFYTSPVFCQNIVQQVGQELNKLYELFRARNPCFEGGVSVAGHSLGSLILFDMLCHQKRPTDESKKDSSTDDSRDSRVVTRTASYLMGNAGTGQPCVTYPQLNFQPNAFFALGSPIGMFVTVRGIDSLGLDFQLPTCPGFYNIFHPYDPVAYRVEVLINPDLATKRPVLIPHHKGRKRMHLELRDTVARLGTEFKQKVVDSVRSTWNAVYQFATLGREQELEQEVNRAIENEMGRTRLESESTTVGEEEDQLAVSSGVVNQGRRVDYVLQEAPLESLNEYLSAIVSHVCYWDSEDTVLFILKDIYSNMGISADSPAVIAALTADDSAAARSPPTPPSPSSFSPPPRFADPTAPMTTSAPVKPPPTSGFVRK